MTAVPTMTAEATASAGPAGAGEGAGTPAGGWGPPEGAARRVPPALAVGRDAIRRPSELEAAVIASAIEALWPRPVVVVPPPVERHGAWRFSGRWWARPSTARRPRPWL